MNAQTKKVFETIYEISSAEIERINSTLVGDDAYKGTFFEGCVNEMTEELKALLKISGQALTQINK